MLISNYHSHTYRCQHADGTEREYVERAIENGIKIWGFSDHTPFPYPDGVKSRIRMTMGELEGYVKTVLDLKREYEQDIEIHLGLEVEYFPPYFEDLMKLREQYPIEYFLLGQHYTIDEFSGPYSGRPTEDITILEDYRRIVIEAMNTGAFLYLAHPDLINYVGDPAIYDAETEKICLEAKRLNIPLEINLLGIYSGRHYPNEQFWKVASRIGNDVILGIDAHSPAHIGYKPALEKAEALVEKYNLKLIGKLNI